MAKKLQSVDFSDSYISIILGFLVVLVGGILLYNFFTKNKSGENTTGTTPTVTEGSNEDETSGVKPSVSTKLPAKYTVVAGDTLWSIAEKFYTSGYNWVDIARENKIDSPELLAEGTQLTIPNTKIIEPQSTITGEASKGDLLPQAVATPKTYTIQKGDTLWGIAIKVYADGYAWPKIAEANHLTHPSLIHAGNTLMIP